MSPACADVWQMTCLRVPTSGRVLRSRVPTSGRCAVHPPPPLYF